MFGKANSKWCLLIRSSIRRLHPPIRKISHKRFKIFDSNVWSCHNNQHTTSKHQSIKASKQHINITRYYSLRVAVYLYYGHRKHYGQKVRFVLAFRQFSQFSRGTRKWALESKPPPTSRILDRTGNYFSTYGESLTKIHLCRDPNLWDSRRKIRNKPPWPRRTRCKLQATFFRTFSHPRRRFLFTNIIKCYNFDVDLSISSVVHIDLYT